MAINQGILMTKKRIRLTISLVKNLILNRIKVLTNFIFNSTNIKKILLVTNSCLSAALLLSQTFHNRNCHVILI